ncbi:hypothetical protein NDU88_004250 [Pleurodeles waltl]|uniref:Uncharacterized protein n=1 Tax=Pleurodeles waltl TaxID=8319 RepID=A0AAV7PJ97_PLEWA|nr:hypothetical protein NDU88_004250 [Pleurodeles waltl]
MVTLPVGAIPAKRRVSAYYKRALKHIKETKARDLDCIKGFLVLGPLPRLNEGALADLNANLTLKEVRTTLQLLLW